MRNNLHVDIYNLANPNLPSQSNRSGQTVAVVGMGAPLQPDGTYVAGNEDPGQPQNQVGGGGNIELDAPSDITYSQELIPPSNSSDVATVSLTVSIVDVDGAAGYDVYLVTA